MESSRKRKPKKSDTPDRYTVRSGDGQSIALEVHMPYGKFVSVVRRAASLQELNNLIGDTGLRLQDVRPLVNYLELSNEQVASLLSISPRTLLRWKDDSPIGVMASRTMLELDKLAKRGAELFGREDLFKQWLQQPNAALGDFTPMALLTKPYGEELVSDALEAMAYGAVL